VTVAGTVGLAVVSDGGAGALVAGCCDCASADPIPSSDEGTVAGAPPGAIAFGIAAGFSTGCGCRAEVPDGDGVFVPAVERVVGVAVGTGSPMLFACARTASSPDRSLSTSRPEDAIGAAALNW